MPCFISRLPGCRRVGFPHFSSMIKERGVEKILATDYAKRCAIDITEQVYRYPN